MIASAFFLAAAGTLATSGSDATNITCNLALPNRSQFRLNGDFDKDGLHSNLSDLVQVERVLAPAATQEVVVINDGTDNYSWRLDSVRDSQKFDVSMTQYGSEAAVLIVERRKFVGRHWGRSLIGVGFCDVRRGQSDEKEP